jgi:Tol biopolymer transport system component
MAAPAAQRPTSPSPPRTESPEGSAYLSSSGLHHTGEPFVRSYNPPIDVNNALRIGGRIGTYEVIAVIGAGGMGQVYRARDTRLGRDIALKVLPPEFAADPERVRRFNREAQLLASLNHPRIASIYGFEDGALVLEFVDGPTLADRIAQGPLPLDEAMSIAAQIADALEAAHTQGIVHRDLKPANVKLRPDGAVKVLDFGLAKSLDPAGVELDPAISPTITVATRAGMILGTAAYMSPEQARGHAADRRADVWAFGCVLYEMLTGRSPFGRETVSDSLAAVLTAAPDWSLLPSSTPPAVLRLLQRCLEKDPRRRLRDTGDARLEIEDALRPDASPAVTTTSRGLATRWVAALVIGAALGGTAIGHFLTTRAPDAAPAFSRVVRLTNGPQREQGAAISPDGKWVAYISDAGGKPDVWVKFLAGGEPANLTAASGLEVSSGTGVGGLEISPDGDRIAVMAREPGAPRYSTWEIPAPLPGRARRVLGENLLAMRWSPDGQHITFINAGGTAGDALWIADADGVNRREILPARDGMHIHWPTWSDDGYIYFIRTFTTIVNLDHSEIYRVDARGTRPMEPVVQTLRRALHPMPLRSNKGLIYSANPQTADMRLWWRSPDGKDTRQLVAGVGEYAETRAAANGSALVSTLYDLRQSLMRIAVGGAAPEMSALTDGYHGDLDPMVSPSGDRVVFSSSRDGNRHVWIARIDGSDARPLTSGASEDDRPAFSPDGRQVAFASDRGGSRGIWIVADDGGPPRKVVDAELIGGLTWTRDGGSLVYGASAGSGPGLFKVSAAGATPQRLATPFFASEPSSSPTGLIAYLSTRREGTIATSTIRFLDADGRTNGLTLPDPRGGNGFPNAAIGWAPDGRRLAVVSQPSNGTATIWIVDPQAQQPYSPLIELPPGPRVRGITWTADGSAVIIGKHDWTSDIVLIDRGK